MLGLDKNVELACRQYSIVGYIIAISATILILKLSKLIEKYLKKIANILSWYGKNTIYIVCLHYLESTLIPYGIFRINNEILIFGIKMIIITSLTYIIKSIIK